MDELQLPLEGQAVLTGQPQVEAFRGLGEVVDEADAKVTLDEITWRENAAVAKLRHDAELMLGDLVLFGLPRGGRPRGRHLEADARQLFFSDLVVPRQSCQPGPSSTAFSSMTHEPNSRSRRCTRPTRLRSVTRMASWFGPIAALFC